MTHVRRCVLLLLACVVASTTANAAPITFSFSGHLTQISSLDPASPFPDPITDDPSNPTPFSGTFTFDSSASNGVSPPDPKTGSYSSVGPPFRITLSLGGLLFSFDGVDISVLNDYDFPVGDQYGASHFESPADTNTPTGVDLFLTLTDLSASAFSGNALPLTPPSLAAFTFTQFFFTDTIADNQVEVQGVIDALNAVRSVPEPGSLALVALGLWLLVPRVVRRRYRLIGG